MSQVPFRFSLITRYGPATFDGHIDADGWIRIPAPPLATLPDAAFRLTYGADWAVVRQHFSELSRFLAYSLQAYRGEAKVPDAYSTVLAELGQPTAKPNSDLAFWAKHAEWRALFHPDQEIRNRSLARLTGGKRADFARQAAAHLEDYLMQLVVSPTLNSVATAYRGLGALRSDRARAFLLDRFAPDGRHPDTRYLLAGLQYFPDPEVLERIRRQYAAGQIAEDDLPQLLEFLASFSQERATELTLTVLQDHANLVDRVVHTLRSQGRDVAAIREAVETRFMQEPEYAYLDGLLTAANRLQAHAIDLAAMNRRAEDARFVEVPPVNWPQQLEAGWRQRVEIEPVDHVTELLTTYLLRPEYRLQRNALLQLKVVIDRTDFPGQLPEVAEDRLRTLLDSPFDKIYVEVLNVLARRNLRLGQADTMLAAVLRVSQRTTYRMVVLKAMRGIGSTPALRALATRLLRQAIATATDEAQLQQITGFMPYAEKYLGPDSGLRELLDDRRSEMPR